jgi:hypothetical protein
MASLNEPGPINNYANALVGLYDRWASESDNQRRQTMATALRAAADAIGMPMPAILWIDREGGAMDYSTWTLECSYMAARFNPRVGTADRPNALKHWLYLTTASYHELRHAEQFWLIAKAILAGKIPMPVMMSRAIVQGGDSPSKLTQQLLYPSQVARQAHMARATFADAQIPLTRGWCDSVFGRYGNIRKQTYAHLMSKGGEHMNKYINLPEEADAWATQRLLKRAVRDRIGASAGTDALQGLATLFD